MQLSIEQKTSMQAKFTCLQPELYLLHAKVMHAVRAVEGAYADATISASFNYREQSWPLGDIGPLTEYEDAFAWNPQYTYELTFHIPPIDQRDAEWLYEQLWETSRDFD